MPAVGDLDRVGGSGARPFGVRAGAIAAHHGRARVCGQPVGEGVGLPVGEDVDGPVGGHVDQDGPVPVPSAQGEVVDTEDLHRCRRRVRKRTDKS